MSNSSSIHHFTAVDIEKYHKGLLTPAEMHALEKAALEDPFLADALEGYTSNDVNLEADITDLQERLAKRIAEKEDRKVIPLGAGKPGWSMWWKAAAIVVLVAGGATIYWQTRQQENQKPETPIAQADKPAPQVQANEKSTVVQNNLQPGAKPDSAEPIQQFKTNEPPVKQGFTTLNTNSVNNSDISQRAYKEEEKRENAADDTEVTSSAKLNEVAIAGKRKAVLDSAREGNQFLAAQQARDISANKARRSADEAANYRQNQSASRQATLSPANGYTFSENGLTNNRQAQQRMNVFRGRVTDQEDNMLPFANITNPIDNIGTYTDANGYFVLTSPDSVLNVQIRSVGFENQQVSLNRSLNSNQVRMLEDNSLNARVIDTSRRVRTVARNTMVHEEHEPADGWNNYDAYIANNLQIPEGLKLLDSNIPSPEVEVSFEVNKYGQAVNLKIVRSTCIKCEQEALRLIKEGPLWKKGKKKKTQVTLSF